MQIFRISIFRNILIPCGAHAILTAATPCQYKTTDYPTESHENQNITDPINNSNTKQKARSCKSRRIRVHTVY